MSLRYTCVQGKTQSQKAKHKQSTTQRNDEFQPCLQTNYIELQSTDSVTMRIQ